MTPETRNILKHKFREVYLAFKLSTQIQQQLEKELAERFNMSNEYAATLEALEADMELSARERAKLRE